MTQQAIQMTEHQHQYGLVAAKIGRSFAHKLSVPLLLAAPVIEAPPPKNLVSRTRIGQNNPQFEYGKDAHGQPLPIKANPGTVVYMEVQDLSRLEEDLVDHVKWTCNHPDCAGKKWGSKEELVRSHPNNRDLILEAKRSANGRAHVYVGVVELAGLKESRDKDGKVTQPATASTVILVSDEE